MLEGKRLVLSDGFIGTRSEVARHLNVSPESFNKSFYKAYNLGYLKYKGVEMRPYKSDDSTLPLKVDTKREAHLARRAKNPIPQWFFDDMVDANEIASLKESKIPFSFKFKFHCPIHNIDYRQNGYHHLEGHTGCPSCKGSKRLSKTIRTKRINNPFPQWFLDELTPESLDDVINFRVSTDSKVNFVCPKHGIYSQVLYSHINMTTHERKAGCPKCAEELSINGSLYETKLKLDLQSLGIECFKSKGLIKSPVTNFPMELDIYCPDYNVAIEVNGLYYHSYEYMNRSNLYNAVNDKKFYHRMKTDLCKEKGIQLIHLFEDDLRDKYDVCLNLIISKLRLHGYKDLRHKIYARKCKFSLVSTNIAKSFYDTYHIQGYGQGCHYGLFYNDNLVSCMSFKRCASNTQDSGSWELNRYATRFDIFVEGGFNKLFMDVVKLHNIQSVVSYADLTVSNGSLYTHHGWTLIKELPVDYKYVYHSKRYHKFNFRISTFKDLSYLKYEEGFTEFQLAQLNGITRIYDCGKLKYKKIIDNG